MKNKIWNILKKVAYTPVLMPIYKLGYRYIYIPYRNKIERKYFNTYALEAMSKFDMCMNEIGVEYTLAFGTMLGAIREKGFIRHDIDIDTFIWFDDFSHEIINKLRDNGFSWISYYTIDDDKYGREDAVSYKGVKIDIFYIYPPIEEYPYCCDFVFEKGMDSSKRLPRRVEFPISRERKLIDFETIKLYVPNNAEEICEFRYGSDYMTPNSKWNWINEKNNIVEWREMVSVTSFHNKL